MCGTVSQHCYLKIEGYLKKAKNKDICSRVGIEYLNWSAKIMKTGKFWKIHYQTLPKPFQHQSHKMVKHTQTIRRRRIVSVCETILWDWRLKG